MAERLLLCIVMLNKLRSRSRVHVLLEELGKELHLWVNEKMDCGYMFLWYGQGDVSSYRNAVAEDESEVMKTAIQLAVGQ